MKPKRCHGRLRAAVLGLALVCWTPALEASVLVNHLGYLVAESKRVLVSDSNPAREFEVLDAADQVVFSGSLLDTDSDLGRYRAGDFTDLRACGRFRIRAGSELSRSFPVGGEARVGYEAALRAASENYFRLQRCGDTSLGYRQAPCHVDDGRRNDNNVWQDASGGWHDASDVRKWLSTQLLGPLALLRVKTRNDPVWDAGSLFDELAWGNLYSLKLQNPDGSLMKYCGGDDGNYWTDNILDNNDDRPLHVEEVDSRTLYLFVAAQAWMSLVYRDLDPGFADAALAAAVRTWDHATLRNPQPPNWFSSGVGILAGHYLHQATGDSRYLDSALAMAERFMSFQETDYAFNQTEVRGFYYTSDDHDEFLRTASVEHLGFVALGVLAEAYPTHTRRQAWLESLRLYAEDFLEPMAARNAFRLLPYGLFTGNDPGGGRRLGDLYYRYFQDPGASWWVGNNANLLLHAAGLFHASRVLDDPGLRALALRQLDWALGLNPFDASTVTGFGHDPIARYVNQGLNPPTPAIDGGVMNGIGGTSDDAPDVAQGPTTGRWQTGEYWTVNSFAFLWALSEFLASTTAVEAPARGLLLAREGSEVRFVFEPAPDAPYHNLYRGSLDELRSGRAWVHHTRVTGASCPGVAEPTLLGEGDALEEPLSYYYQVGGNDCSCEGPTTEDAGFSPAEACYDRCP